MKYLFIAGSAREHIPEKYIQEGKQIADYLLTTSCNICCCADERGIIGKIYQQFKTQRQRLFFAIPKVYEQEAKKIGEPIDKITDTINQRTDVLIQKADICLVLPGGIGTIYELLSMLESKRAGEHEKEIIIVNSYGIYNPLLELLENLCKENFAQKEDKRIYHVVDNAQEAIVYLKTKL